MNFSEDEGKEIRETCLRLLTRREHSKRELIDKISLKGFERNDIQIVVEDLESQGWQSDQRFAESYARHRIKKGYGPLKIQFELCQRGVKEVDLDAVVQELAGDWLEVLQQVYHKKYSEDGVLTAKEWLKRSRFMQQRGFSYDMINMFLSKK